VVQTALAEVRETKKDTRVVAKRVSREVEANVIGSILAAQIHVVHTALVVVRKTELDVHVVAKRVSREVEANVIGSIPAAQIHVVHTALVVVRKTELDTHVVARVVIREAETNVIGSTHVTETHVVFHRAHVQVEEIHNSTLAAANLAIKRMETVVNISALALNNTQNGIKEEVEILCI